MESSCAGAALTSGQILAIIRAIDERYGFEASDLTRLGGELDLNFRATDCAGEHRFVRLTPVGFEPASIEWQNTVLRQLAGRPLSVKTPRLVTQVDGSAMSVVDMGDGLVATLRMMTWVPGVNVAELGATDARFRNQIGELAAEVVESLSPLNHPSNDQNEHHWMVTRSGDSLRTTMAAVDDQHCYAMAAAALEQFDLIADQIPRLPRTVVHQDLHDFNLLAHVNEHGQASISGVVDFNDAVHTVRVAELAVAAAYVGLRQDDPFAAFSDVVAGYLSRSRLEDLELDLLYPLAVARLAVNGSTWTARGKYGNTAYAESRMEATWPVLELLLEVQPDLAAMKFRALRDQVQSPSGSAAHHRTGRVSVHANHSKP